MHESALAEPGAAQTVPSLAEAVFAAYRAGVTEGQSATLLYAPTTIHHTVNHAPAAVSAPAAQDAPVRVLPGPDAPSALVTPPQSRRHYSRADLYVFLGSGVLTGAGAESALAGYLYTTGQAAHLLLTCTLLTGVPLLGGLLLLAAAAISTRQEKQPQRAA